MNEEPASTSTPASTPGSAPTGRGARSRQAILTAACALFSELGYEQTTVRAVAQRAGVDPALVMKHFGSKDGLFDAVTAAADFGLGLDAAPTGPADRRGEQLLAQVLADLDGRPDRSMPVLRSMLTHPQAAETVRCAVTDPARGPLAGTLTGEDAPLRAALAGSVVLGLLVSRYLLHVPEVDDAPADRLAELLGPALHPLLTDSLPTDSADAPSTQPALKALAAAEAQRAAAAARVDDLAREALAAGASFGEVGRALGISRQAARKRWPHEEPAPTEHP